MFKFFRAPAILLAGLAVPQLALAHAVLVSSTPREGQVVHAGRLHIDLQFNSRLDGSRCTISLASPDGASTSLTLDGQKSPDTLSADTDVSHEGAYTLRWQALAADGHITRGQIAFRVD